MREKLKNRSGITIVSLVVTIIILIMLVGVTIATLIGRNEILGKAKTAKTETIREGAKEKIQIAVLRKL